MTDFKMTYGLMIIDKSLSGLEQEGVGIGDYVFHPTGTSVAVAIVQGAYEEWLLDEYVAKGVITPEAKTHYMSSNTSSNAFDIHEIPVPPSLIGQGIDTEEDLMRHLEDQTINELGDMVTTYQGGVTGIADASDFDEIISLYTAANKFILIKNLNKL